MKRLIPPPITSGENNYSGKPVKLQFGRAAFCAGKFNEIFIPVLWGINPALFNIEVLIVTKVISQDIVL